MPTPEGLATAWQMEIRTPDGQHWYDAHINAATGTLIDAADWVSSASYNVYPAPTAPRTMARAARSRIVMSNPADPIASPFGWHDTNGVAGAEFTDTRGNNVSRPGRRRRQQHRRASARRRRRR